MICYTCSGFLPWLRVSGIWLFLTKHNPSRGCILFGKKKVTNPRGFTTLLSILLSFSPFWPVYMIENRRTANINYLLPYWERYGVSECEDSATHYSLRELRREAFSRTADISDYQLLKINPYRIIVEQILLLCLLSRV